MRHQLVKFCKILWPIRAYRFIDQLSQRRVTRVKPPTRRDPVGLVDNAIRVGLMQLRKYRLLHQIRVQRRYAIHPVCHDKGQFPHFDRTVFNNSSPPTGLLQVLFLDDFDDLVMAR